MRLDHSCIRISRGCKLLSAKTLSSSFKYFLLYLATFGSFPFLFFLLFLQGPREGYTTSRTCVVFSRGENVFLKFRGFSSSPLLFFGLGFAPSVPHANSGFPQSLPYLFLLPSRSLCDHTCLVLWCLYVVNVTFHACLLRRVAVSWLRV